MKTFNHKKHLGLNRIGYAPYYNYKEFKKKRYRNIKKYQINKNKFSKKSQKTKIQKYALRHLKRELKYELKVYYLIRAFFDFKIIRQYIINDKYIADIFLPEKNLVIEIDGKYHDDNEQKIKDKKREEYIESMGFEVLRFKNEEIEEDLLQVLSVLQEKFPTQRQQMDSDLKVMLDLPNT